NDLIESYYLPTMMIMGGDLVRELGWILLPDLVRLYGDTVLALLAKKRKIDRYRDDVIVEHMHFGVGKAAYDETAKKPSAIQDRVTFDKWRWSFDPTVHFVAVKWGTKYSADYVNILFDMVKRNLPKGFGYRFTCFTEDATGLDEGIDIQPLPEGVIGWWNKLYLFKKRLFDEGERIVFLDLDTAITGNIGDIASYKGEFATLRDFYRPRGLQSSIMLWRSGFGNHIWDMFLTANKPDIEGGDQAWIERVNPNADILQDLFPGAFASFKERGQIEPPPGTKIVCFHGDPRPHQVKDNWVERVWKKGGVVHAAEASSAVELLKNVEHAMTLPLPNLQQANAPHPGEICLVGGGASRAACLEELRQRQQKGQEIWALDGAYQWLIENNITPNAQIMFTADQSNAAFVPTRTDATLFYASQCHPDVFTKAANAASDIIIWYPMIDGIRNVLKDRKAVFIGGGTTTGMIAISLAFTLGCRAIHLYGYDSSYPDATGEDRMQVNVDGRSFTTSVRMAQQINEFKMLIGSLVQQKTGITLHGDGLLPFVMQQMSKAQQKAS
ncbi:MAG TPA: 6-hydroxymethylpterin diphosphokinase MptE-like protein, partial [Alphaproteobacteria bacterium]|nr:6-hydroxymethylpterin diphosphokinase MptE-like protein [Alphaproteobacteria bacterium]